MADTTITNMPAGTAIVDADLFCMDQGGLSTNKNPASAIKTYIAAVSGPVSSTINAIARYADTTGKVLKDYTSNPPTITDNGQVFIGPSGIPTVGTAFNTFANDLNSNVVVNSFQATGTVNAAGTVQALNFTVSDTGANSTTSLAGITGTATKSGSGTVTNLIGVSGAVRIQGTTVATNMTAYTAAVRLQAGTSAVTVVSYNAPVPTVLSTATVTSMYGFRVAGQKIAGVTTGYGFASDGVNDLNYHMGLSGFGLLAPTAYVHCLGSTTTNASLRIASGTAPTSPNDGDMWYDGTNLKFQVGGVTKTVTLT